MVAANEAKLGDWLKSDEVVRWLIKGTSGIFVIVLSAYSWPKQANLVLKANVVTEII